MPVPGTGLYSLALGQVTSMLIVTLRKTRVFTGTVEQLESQYRTVLLHNLLFGWWGFPYGIVWTPLWLWRNRKARQRLRELAGANAATS